MKTRTVEKYLTVAAVAVLLTAGAAARVEAEEVDGRRAATTQVQLFNALPGEVVVSAELQGIGTRARLARLLRAGKGGPIVRVAAHKATLRVMLRDGRFLQSPIDFKAGHAFCVVLAEQEGGELVVTATAAAPGTSLAKYCRQLGPRIIGPVKPTLDDI